METIFKKIYQSQLGNILIEGNEEAITAVHFMEEGQLFDELDINGKVPVIIDHCAFLLNEYFAGRLTDFDIAVNPQGTPFQQEIWKLLRVIPFGTTQSYLELAKKYGDVKAIRAVAAANGKNPVAVIIPCHRVIGSNGELTGYSGKLWRKKWLLQLEQVKAGKQQSLFEY